MKRFILISLILTIFSTHLFADETGNTLIVYEKGKRNWFFEAGVNGNIYFGQQDNQLMFLNRIGWGGSANFGKWITPCIGLKMELNAADYFGAALYGENANFVKSKKYWNRSYSQNNLDNLQFQHFFAFNPNIDVMFSLFNSLGKVKEMRVFDMILSFGGGVFVNNGANVEESLNENGRRILLSPSFNIGLQNKFRLAEQVDMNIDLRAGYISNSFDGQKMSGGKYRMGDIVASAGISFTYKFKPRGYSKIKAIEDKSCELERYKNLYISAIRQNDSLKEANNALLASNADLISKLAAQPQIEYVEHENNTKVIAILEYKIGVSELNKENRTKLKEAAKIIKANPEYTFEICGYADNETGSKDINIRLRNARANRAIDQLLHYGVNRNQLLKSTNDGNLPGTTTRAIVIRQLDCD